MTLQRQMQVATQNLVVPGWNSVSDDQKAEIMSILEGSGLIGPNAEITADPAKPEFAPGEEAPAPEGIWTPICKAACDTAAAAATAACATLSGGVAIAACVAAAAAAREICRNEC